MSRSDQQNQFYWSIEWRRLRKYVMEKYNYICQQCNEPAKVVHHIEWITDSNLHDPEITLNEDNLIPLCQECHNNVHGFKGLIEEGLVFDSDGNIIKL